MNKYGDPVAGLMLPDLEEQEQTTGLIFVFPQLERRADLVIELVDRVLPDMAPRLFPDVDASQWTRLPEYDLLGIGELRNEINQVAWRSGPIRLQITGKRDGYDPMGSAPRGPGTRATDGARLVTIVHEHCLTPRTPNPA